MATNNEKVSKYIVLEFAEDCDNVGYITHRDKIESGNLCETYGKYGQSYGCDRAGCYALSSSNSSIHSDLLLAIEAEFGTKIHESFGDTHGMSFSSVEEFIELVSELDEVVIDIDKLEEFAEKWVSDNESHTQCSHFTYWDGSNFKSIVISSEFDMELDWSECDEDKSNHILSGFDGALDVYSGASASKTVGKYTYITTRDSDDPWLAIVSEQ